MKKPTIRVTKWLGDIPVEAGCSTCPAVVFRANGSGHRPSREEFQKSIRAQFDAHWKAVHSREQCPAAKVRRSHAYVIWAGDSTASFRASTNTDIKLWTSAAMREYSERWSARPQFEHVARPIRKAIQRRSVRLR